MNTISEARKLIGDYIRSIREEKDLSRLYVSEFCSVTEKTIEKIENGAFSYSIDLFLKLSVCLDFKITFETSDKNRSVYSRFKLVESSTLGYSVLTDVENQIVCNFKNGAFNETQKFTFLKDSVNHKIVPSVMKDFGDFLLVYYPSLI